MNHRLCRALIALMCGGLAARPAAADAPRQMYYRGQLTASPAFTGNRNVTFTIYDAAAGGGAVFTESQSVAVSSGVFTSLVGSATSGGIPDAALVGADRWLDVSVDGEPAASRQKLGAAPYAMSVAGINVTGGNVGIGTSTPSAKLDVQGGIINASGGFSWNGQSLDARYAPLSSSGTAAGSVTAAQVAPGSFQSGAYTFPGTVNWGDAGSRTDYKDDAGAAASRSGFFQTAAPVNYYAGASSWQHLIEARHSNPGNNYALQIAGSFFDQDLYFRKTNNSAATPWSKVVAENGSGNVGIGTPSPTARLEVRGGAIKASGGLVLQTFPASDTTSPRPGDAGAVWLEQSTTPNLGANGGVHLGADTPCNGGLEGTIRYNKSAKRVELCDGAQWQPISVVQQITQQIVQETAPTQGGTPPPPAFQCTYPYVVAPGPGQFSVPCPLGTFVTGGGVQTNLLPGYGNYSVPWGNSWYGWAGAPGDVVYAICCTVAAGK